MKLLNDQETFVTESVELEKRGQYLKSGKLSRVYKDSH